MIRPALELAWAVAKLGEQARPAVVPPGRLRPLMRFAKLPDRALSTVRHVVEDDDEFRARVAEVADESVLDRAPWLWLVRPEGWAEELAALTDAAGAAALEVQVEREERSARRRLAAAEAASARAEAELSRYQETNAGLSAELAAERQLRRRAEADRDRIESARRAAEVELSALTQTVAPMEARISSLATDLDESGRRLSAIGQERDAARAEVEALRTRLGAADAEAARQGESLDKTRRDVVAAVARAATAARQLGESLADVARLVSGDSTEAASDPASVGPGASSGVVRPGPVPRPFRRAPRLGAGRQRCRPQSSTTPSKPPSTSSGSQGCCWSWTATT